MQPNLGRRPPRPSSPCDDRIAPHRSTHEYTVGTPHFPHACRFAHRIHVFSHCTLAARAGCGLTDRLGDFETLGDFERVMRVARFSVGPSENASVRALISSCLLRARVLAASSSDACLQPVKCAGDGFQASTGTASRDGQQGERGISHVCSAPRPPARVRPHVRLSRTFASSIGAIPLLPMAALTLDMPRSNADTCRRLGLARAQLAQLGLSLIHI